MSTTIDTNILVYAADPTSGDRHHLAKPLVTAHTARQGALPQQVLGEFLNVGRRISRLDQQDIRQLGLALTMTCMILPTTPDLLFDAFDLAARHKLQFWDALILTVCRANGVTTLLTEDMQDGATVDGVTILNPFAPANRARLERALA